VSLTGDSCAAPAASGSARRVVDDMKLVSGLA
jgi:hypothetical protein